MHRNVKVVLFGPAHSGKSTLAGYLSYLAAPEAAELDIQRARRELDHDFDEAQALAYLVDRSADERRRTHSAKQGTSKRLHISGFNLRSEEAAHVDYFTIDTPGAEHASSDRFKGMFFADIGLICVECKNVINDNPFGPGLSSSQFGQALSMILTWKSMRSGQPLLVVLTKADQYGWSESDLDEIALTAQDLRSRMPAGLVVLPISIDVKARTSRNVIEPIAAPRWPCLHDAIADMARSLIPAETDKVPETAPGEHVPLFFGSRATANAAGLRISGKLLAGTIRPGDNLSIYPRGHASWMAKPRVIERSGQTQTVDALYAGEMGSLTFGSKHPVTPSFTLVSSPSVPVHEATIIKVRVELSNAAGALKSHIGEQIEFLYAGIRISGKLIDVAALSTAPNELGCTCIIRGQGLLVPVDPLGDRPVAQLRSIFVLRKDKSADGEILFGGELLEWGLKANVTVRHADLRRALESQADAGEPYATLRDIDSATVDGLMRMWSKVKLHAKRTHNPIPSERPLSLQICASP